MGAKRKRRKQRAVLQAGLLAVLFVPYLYFCGAARAQSFFVSLPVEQAFVLQGGGRNLRLTLAAYAALWENPFRITVTTFSIPRGGLVSGQFRVIAETPASPLFEASYKLARHWSLGFWYNPIRGERLRKTVSVADVAVALDLTRDTDLGDLHLVYDGPRGLSAQVGYYRESGTIRNAGTNAPPRDYTLVSWNLWITQRLDVRLHGRIIAPFISAGYHPASGLDHAASILTGVSVALNQRISLSGSVWLFDLSHPATRVTAGVVVRL